MNSDIVVPEDNFFYKIEHNPCNWDGRYWMPTMVGNPQGPILDKFGTRTRFLNMEPQGQKPLSTV
jgi:hypothetical protein